MSVSIAPTALLDPRFAFAVFLFLFFGPVLPEVPAKYVVVVFCGATYLLAGAISAEPVEPGQRPAYRANMAVLPTIVVYWLYSFSASPQFDLSPEVLGSALLLSLVAHMRASERVVDSTEAVFTFHAGTPGSQRERMTTLPANDDRPPLAVPPAQLTCAPCRHPLLHRLTAVLLRWIGLSGARSAH